MSLSINYILTTTSHAVHKSTYWLLKHGIPLFLKGCPQVTLRFWGAGLRPSTRDVRYIICNNIVIVVLTMCNLTLWRKNTYRASQGRHALIIFEGARVGCGVMGRHVTQQPQQHMFYLFFPFYSRHSQMHQLYHEIS